MSDRHAAPDVGALAAVKPPAGRTLTAARRVVLTHAQRYSWPRVDVADVLAMLGLTKPRQTR